MYVQYMVFKYGNKYKYTDKKLTTILNFTRAHTGF